MEGTLERHGQLAIYCGATWTMAKMPVLGTPNEAIDVKRSA